MADKKNISEAEHTKAIGLKDAEIESLKRELEGLKASPDEKDAEIGRLKSELEVAQETALQAVNEANAANESTTKELTVKVEGKLYQINFGVHHNGVDYTAKDIAANQALAEELIKIGSGSLELKEG